MQFQVQPFKATGGDLEVLCQDLLKLSGYGGYRDGIPHLKKHCLQVEKREQVVSDELVHK